MSRQPPKPDPEMPSRRLAANQHDIAARYLVEECVLGKPGSYMLVAALLKSFEWHTEARGRRNRRLSPVELLDHLASVYGVEPGVVKVAADGEEAYVYAIPYLTFKRDPSLNQRLKYDIPATLRPDLIEAQRGPPKPKPPAMTPEQEKERRKTTRTAWYAKNKDRITRQWKKKHKRKRRRR